MTDITKQLAEVLRHIENAATDLRVQRYEIRAAATEALAAFDAQQAAQAVPADMLPSAEHIKEIAGELVTQAMEQAQVFASAWALVGSRFDAGNEMDNAEQQKADLRTIIQRPRRPCRRDGAPHRISPRSTSTGAADG